MTQEHFRNPRSGCGQDNPQCDLKSHRFLLGREQMKMLLTSVLLLVLGSGRVQCQLRLDNSEVSCVRNGDDYRLLDDGRVVRSGESSNVNDVMLKLPVDKWHRGARLLGVFDLDAGQEQAVIGSGRTLRGPWRRNITFRSLPAKRAGWPRCSVNSPDRRRGASSET